VSARKSSYYCLTPASSTTSLSDLNNSKSLLEDFNATNNTSQIIRQKKAAKTKQILTTQQSLASVRLDDSTKECDGEEIRPSSKKRTRLSIDTYKCAGAGLETSLNRSTTNNNNNSKLTHTLSASTFMQPTAVALALNNREVVASVSGSGRGRRGRGRPPKNQNLVISSSSTASTLIFSNNSNRSEANLINVNSTEETKRQYEDCDEQKEAKKTQHVDVTNVNAVAVVDAAAAASATVNIASKQIDTNTTATTKANSKLIKSLINKSSSNSNLQKSKVQVDSNENRASSSKAITKSESSSNLLQKKSNVSLFLTKLGLFTELPLFLHYFFIYHLLKLSTVNPNSNQQLSGYLIDKVNDVTYLNKQQTQQQQPQHNSYYLNSLNTNSIKNPQADTENNYIICTKSSVYPPSGDQTYTNVKSNATSKLTNNENTLATVDTQEQSQNTPMVNLNWANGADLWKVMRSKELKYAHDHLYLKRHSGIEPQMRAILLDWLVEISYAYRLHRETWHLAVEYMDRFMTCCKSQMRVDRLQLIGMSALFLAAKVEEIYPPKLKEFASHMENYTHNNEDAIQQFELFILKTLNWEISPVTANTWLMTYMQIASINYYTNLKNYYNRDEEDEAKQASRSNSKVHNSHMVMPLHIYKNSNSNLKDFKSSTNLQTKQSSNNKTTYIQQQFYLNNYMKSVTLLDLCMFDMESLKHTYSELAAAAMYHMLSFATPSSLETSTASSSTTTASQYDAHLNAYIVQKCTGYTLYELDSCIKWMYPYADVCKDILTDEKMTFIKTFSNVDPEDAHNIQLYYQNLDLLVSSYFVLLFFQELIKLN
jgi:hypothetical protein